jgi:hypothetical protein
MSKVLRIVVSPATDTTILDIGGGICVPFTYHAWGGNDAGIKRNFNEEVTTGNVHGVEVDLSMYAHEMADSSAHTIYTAEDGWLI